MCAGAIAAVAHSGLALGVTVVFGAALWVWGVKVEEPHLREVFGARYQRYLASAPRFLGLPRG